MVDILTYSFSALDFVGSAWGDSLRIHIDMCIICSVLPQVPTIML